MLNLIRAVALSFLAALLSACGTVPANAPVEAEQPVVAAVTPRAAQPAQPAPSRAPQVIPTGPLQPITAGEVASMDVAPLKPPAELWERIRRGFAMPDLDTDLVRDREQWYVTRPDYIARMVERSSKYLFHIVEELERRNMPTELALLPFIESAFNPQAVSSAKAAGMWQFIPSTGKTFDLRQNLSRDDRRDVLASTRAALDYLQKLYGMFGDWQLALAAYNWGEGSVARAIAKNQRLGLGTRYQDLSMPNETRYYVPKLQAVKNIVARPQAFQVSLPIIENHPYFQTVDITRDIDVELAARLADVRLEDFRALNPSANQPVILGAGRPQVLLPWDNAAVFERNLNAYNGPRLASWTAWVAPGTMKPAEAARRVGMSERDFRAVNRIPGGMLIKGGSTLLVPRPASRDEDVASHVAENGQLALAPELVLRRTVVKAGRGDTLASLARRYGVSEASVREWNRSAGASALKAGQQVVLFLPAKTNVASRATKGRPPAATRYAGKNTRKPTRVAHR